MKSLAAFAAAMFASGSLLNDFITSFLKDSKKYFYIEITVLFISFIAIALLAFFFKDYTNMYYGHIAFGVFGIAVAFAGISGVVVLSKWIDKMGLIIIYKVLTYLGRNSLVIFGTHLAFKGVFVRIWGSIAVSNIGLYFAALSFILGGALLMVELINRYALWTIGRFTRKT